MTLFGLPVVADPAFYAVAIPAMLVMGLSKSGFGSGFGALAVPLMALAVPVPQAAAILLPLLLVMDAIGLRALWRERDRDVLRLLLPAGLAGVGVGALTFGALPARTVAGIVGAATLAFLALRLVRRSPAGAPPPSSALGRACAAVSGFTSFVAHAGSPPLGPYLLPLRLTPPRLAGTLAVFFAAVNAAKLIPYAALGLIDTRNLATSALLAPLAPVGVLAGVRLMRRISTAWGYRLFEAGMLATGLKLLWDGFA